MQQRVAAGRHEAGPEVTDEELDDVVPSVVPVDDDPPVPHRRPREGGGLGDDVLPQPQPRGPLRGGRRLRRPG